MAKRKKRRAPKRTLSAKPAVDDDELSSDEAEDASAGDEEHEHDEDHDEDRDEDREAPTAKADERVAPRSKARTEPAPTPRAIETRAAPANAGLMVMGVVFGLMILGIVAAAFMD